MKRPHPESLEDEAPGTRDHGYLHAAQEERDPHSQALAHQAQEELSEADIRLARCCELDARRLHQASIGNHLFCVHREHTSVRCACATRDTDQKCTCGSAA